MPTAALLVTASLSGLQVRGTDAFCREHRSTGGTFESDRQEVVLCEDNLDRLAINRSEVVRHELLHALQHRLKGGENLLPMGVLEPLIRHLLPDEETMAVLMLYPDVEKDSELEARLLSRMLPNGAIAALLLATGSSVSGTSGADGSDQTVATPGTDGPSRRSLSR
ncbi:hypothetical protein EVJ50_02625 [Synechococcus sp. RSCCF101]|uniref:hypothetical protein n=1 Tax=Synechococcus sp. RSCCF101 TaxID=2511069 RepID=UPI00124745E4|nr:hypothetical protein [Synechococcus sp. RSCCF101]QEY31305.1 hypothetical protein EVJ50_02625 [Synechococcus sp. RSCCF101]